MGLHFVIRENVIIIHGDTYRHRDAIRALGGRFDGKFKTWQVPFSKSAMEEIQKLQNPQSPQPPTDTPSASAPDIAGEKAGLPVRELVNAVAQSVAAGFPGPVWVVGEIENLTVRPQGIFLNLAEPKGDQRVGGAGGSGSISVKATIWPNALDYMRRMHGEDILREVLQDGMQVRCLCRIGFYKDRAQLSLTIENIDPLFTKGALALARELLMKELRAKGLDRANKMLPLPVFPLRVGLVSSAGSRAETDFVHQLESGSFPGTLLFVHAATQGEKVPVEVPSAIELLASSGCDLIVITRGGGGAADLRWFDAREVAFAIAACPVPVVAAIGHHEDTCVAEEICHTRQKTPTAAAQFIIDTIAQSRTRIDAATDGLKNAIDRMAEVHMRWFENLAGQLVTGAIKVIMDHAAILATVENRLTALDPKPWLERGWTRLSVDGETIDSITRLQKGMRVHARLRDGPVTMVVESAGSVQESHDGERGR